ncbi:MAG: hypothetical protein ACREHG_02600, partial [Candidatus Saccharimonadales bacterium]
YPALSKDMAMKIGDQSKPDQLNSEAWARFSDETGFTAAPLKRLGTEIAARVNAALPDLQKHAEAACPAVKSDIYPARRRAKFFENYSAVIKKNCNMLEQSLR